MCIIEYITIVSYKMLMLDFNFRFIEMYWLSKCNIFVCQYLTFMCL